MDELLKPDADVEVFKERLLELRKRVKRDIYAWTKSFVNEFQRQPNKQERKDVAGAMFKAYSGVRYLLFYHFFFCLFGYFRSETLLYISHCTFFFLFFFSPRSC